MPIYIGNERSWLRAFLSVAAIMCSLVTFSPMGPVSTASEEWICTFARRCPSICSALIWFTLSRSAAMTVAPSAIGQCNCSVTITRFVHDFPPFLSLRGSTMSLNLQHFFLPRLWPFLLPHTRDSSKAQSSVVKCSLPRRMRERSAAHIGHVQHEKVGQDFCL